LFDDSGLGVTFRSDLRDMGTGVRSRIDRMRDAVHRTAAGVVLLRLIVGVAAFAALALAFPASTLLPPGLWVLAFFAVGTAMAPRSRWVALVALTALAGWLTTTIGYGEEIALWRVSSLGAALYLMHTGAALAAVLPYDAVISPGVLVRWFRRTAAIVAVSLIVGVSALIVAERLRAEATLAAPLIGVAAAAALALVLVSLVRRG
jgi:hypothetical protein